MPPSFGNRDDSSATANPCGMKKKTAAINHISNDPGPNFAVVPRCLRPRTATRLNRTRSRSLSARTSFGVVCIVSVVINVQKRREISYSEFNREMIDEIKRLVQTKSCHAGEAQRLICFGRLTALAII